MTTLLDRVRANLDDRIPERVVSAAIYRVTPYAFRLLVSDKTLVDDAGIRALQAKLEGDTDALTWGRVFRLLNRPATGAHFKLALRGMVDRIVARATREVRTFVAERAAAPPLDLTDVPPIPDNLERPKSVAHFINASTKSKYASGVMSVAGYDPSRGIAGSILANRVWKRDGGGYGGSWKVVSLLILESGWVRDPEEAADGMPWENLRS